MDKILVRISAICMSLWMVFSIIFAWFGHVIPFFDVLFGASVISGLLITVLSFSQGRYHCKWMQCICVNILLTQIINVSLYDFVSDESILLYLIVISSTWVFSTLLAFYFAISHFIKVKRIKRLKNG